MRMHALKEKTKTINPIGTTVGLQNQIHVVTAMRLEGWAGEQQRHVDVSFSNCRRALFSSFASSRWMQL